MPARFQLVHCAAEVLMETTTTTTEKTAAPFYSLALAHVRRLASAVGSHKIDCAKRKAQNAKRKTPSVTSARTQLQTNNWRNASLGVRSKWRRRGHIVRSWCATVARRFAQPKLVAKREIAPSLRCRRASKVSSQNSPLKSLFCTLHFP